MTLFFTAEDVMKTEKNDVSLCKLEVNVKNRMEIACSVGFFIISYERGSPGSKENTKETKIADSVLLSCSCAVM